MLRETDNTIIETAHESPGDHTAAETHARNVATPSARPKVELDPTPARAEPGGGLQSSGAHTACAAATPSARRRVTGNRSTSASAGIAQTRRADQYETGDPTPYDPANVVAQPAYLSPGPDDGLSAPRDSQGSAAVVPLSEPATRIVRPKAVVRARGAARYRRDDQSTRGGSDLSGPTIHVVDTGTQPSGQGGGQCSRASQSLGAAPNHSASADHASDPEQRPPERGDGPCSTEAQLGSAVAKSLRRSKRASEPAPADGSDGQSRPEDQSTSAVAVIVDLWRQRCAIQRTAISVSLQAQAMCRRVIGDKDAARKEWSLIQKGKGTNPDLAMVVEPYRQMVELAENHAKGLEKQLTKLVRKLPLWAWASEVRGLGELSLAGIIGHAAGNPGDYKSVSAIWKRFGLAVLEGQRQRRVSDPDLALIHGYAPERRAFAYVVSCNLMKSQGSEGPYRAIYDRRKVYEMEEKPDPVTKAHAHNRALRVMVKALLRDVYLADSRMRGGAE